MSKTIAAIFDRSEFAESAARQLKGQGFETENISIVAKHGDEDNSVNMKDSRGVIKDNISDGVITGGILGGLAGLLLWAGSMVIPGLGIVAAAGPITGLLSGAVTEGIVRGLIDLGIPQDKSKQYETDIKAGKVLFTMTIEDDQRAGEASDILKNNGAESVETY